MSNQPVSLSDDDLAHVSGGVGMAATHKTGLTDFEEMAVSLAEKGGDRDTGLPSLDQEVRPFSAEQMAALIQSLQNKSQDTQLKTAKDSIEAAREKAEQNFNEKTEKIAEWIEKAESGSSQSLQSKIIGEFGQIVAAHLIAPDKTGGDIGQEKLGDIMAQFQGVMEQSGMQASEAAKQFEIMLLQILGKLGAGSTDSTKKTAPAEETIQPAIRKGIA